MGDSLTPQTRKALAKLLVWLLADYIDRRIWLDVAERPAALRTVLLRDAQTARQTADDARAGLTVDDLARVTALMEVAT